MPQIVPIQDAECRRFPRSRLGLDNIEVHHRLLFQNARDAILIARNGVVIESNPAAWKLFGCPADALTEIFPERFCPRRQPDGRLSAEAADERIAGALSGVPQFFTWRYLRTDGEPVETEISLNRVDPDDTAMLQVIIRDVTRRACDEEAIRAGEQRFRGLFDAMVEGVALHQMVCGPDGRAEDYIIEAVNPAFERILGLSGESVAGRRFTEIYGADSAPYLEIYTRVIETGRPESFETRFAPLNKQFSVTAFSQGPGRFATVFADISEAKKTEADLARQRVYLEVLLGKKDLQLAEASEQIRTEVDQRIEAEAALRASEERYRGIFENTGSGMVILDADLKILLANTVVADFTGYRRDEIEGRMNGLDLLVADDACRLRADRERQLRGEKVPSEYECRVRARNGRIRHILLRLSPVAGSDQTVASMMDITERKAAEETLARSEESYRSLFEHAGAATMILEEDMTIARINPQFEAIFGYSRTEVEGRMKWTRMAHPEDVERMKRYHRERRRPGGTAPSDYECRFLDSNGGVHQIYIKVGMLPDGRRSIGSLIDLTDRLAAEAELKRSQAQLSDIIDATEGLIYTVDADYRIGFMNKAMIERTGRDAAGQLCYRVFRGRGAPCPDCFSDRVFRGEIVKQETRNSLDGRWYYGIHTPLRGEDGRIRQKQVVFLDITERKIAEEAMRENESQLRKENRRLRAGMKDRYRFGGIVGKSLAMQRVYDLLLKAAGSDANTIVYGESGTGKELAARAVHDMSERRDNPFVPVNCGAIPEHLLESEFFGYKKGAFTGATSDKRGFLDIADGGTLFLDEVGELGPAMQVKLLRAIEGGGFLPVGGQRPRKPDVRIVAATNRDLAERVAAGAMREDFYYRIHVIPVELPPLRERKEDLPLLIDHFLRTLNKGETALPMTARMMEKFYRYDWPGNVRELENVMARYLTLRRIDLQERPAKPAPTLLSLSGPEPFQGDGSRNLKAAVEEFEKSLILRTLDANRWQRSKAATLLGIHRKTLFTKMRQYNLAEN